MTTPLPPGAAPRSNVLDFAQAFRFFFEDPDWVKKLLIGGLLALGGVILIPTIFSAGYALRVVRRTAAGEARPLPEFDDWGGLFVDGIKVAAVYLGHLALVMIGPAIIFLVSIAMTGGFAVDRRNTALEGLVGLGIFVAYLLLIGLSLALMVYMPAPLARLAQTDSIGAAFDVRQNVAFIHRNLANYGLTLLLYLITSFATQIGLLLCCVGVFPATFWAMSVLGWSIGSTIAGDPQTRSTMAVRG